MASGVPPSRPASTTPSHGSGPRRRRHMVRTTSFNEKPTSSHTITPYDGCGSWPLDSATREHIASPPLGRPFSFSVHPNTPPLTPPPPCPRFTPRCPGRRVGYGSPSRTDPRPTAQRPSGLDETRATRRFGPGCETPRKARAHSGGNTM